MSDTDMTPREAALEEALQLLVSAAEDLRVPGDCKCKRCDAVRHARTLLVPDEASGDGLVDPALVGMEKDKKLESLDRIPIWTTGPRIWTNRAFSICGSCGKRYGHAKQCSKKDLL